MHEPDEALQLLREAAEIGWQDIAAGRYVDVREEDIDAFVDGIGRQVLGE
ncbi:MAG: hypothetical protein ACTHW1_07315 [Ancrocorticia sp.]